METRNFYKGIQLYPGAELKGYIGINTLKGFSVAMLGLFLLTAIYFALPAPTKIIQVIQDKITDKVTKVLIDDTEPVKRNSTQGENVNGEVNAIKGTKEVAGTPIATEENNNKSVFTFAPVENTGFSLATHGNPAKSNEIPTVLSNDEVVPDEFEKEFVAAEILPEYDIAELQKNLIYPVLARRVGIEGSVLVKAIIDIDGSIADIKIISSDNIVLNKAATDAITKTKFSPAVQNGFKVRCPIIINVVFRIRD